MDGHLKASIDVTPFVAVLFAIFAAVLVTRPSLAALNVDSPPHGPTYDATFAPDGSLYVRRHVGDGEYRYLPEEDVFWRVYPLGGDRILGATLVATEESGHAALAERLGPPPHVTAAVVEVERRVDLLLG